MPSDFTGTALQTCPRNKSAYLLPDKTVKGLREWTTAYGTTPRERSTNLKESRLARDIKMLKHRNKFDKVQLEEIEDIYHKFGPCSGTSIFEQILYFYLRSATENALVLNRNTESFGYEIDVLIKNISETVAVFYDGAAFHQDAERDTRINTELTMQNVLVLRFREEGCPSVDNCVTIPVPKNPCYQDFLKLVKTYFTDTNCPIRNMICTKTLDEEQILNKARRAGSKRYAMRKHILKYIETALLTEDAPPSTSNTYRNCKVNLQRGLFIDKEQLLLAFVKRIFNTSPRKRKVTDTPTVINDDIVLLSRIIACFHKNTPYDRTVFKKALIENINNMD